MKTRVKATKVILLWASRSFIRAKVDDVRLYQFSIIRNSWQPYLKTFWSPVICASDHPILLGNIFVYYVSYDISSTPKSKLVVRPLFGKMPPLLFAFGWFSDIFPVNHKLLIKLILKCWTIHSHIKQKDPLHDSVKIKCTISDTSFHLYFQSLHII